MALFSCAVQAPPFSGDATTPPTAETGTVTDTGPTRDTSTTGATGDSSVGHTGDTAIANGWVNSSTCFAFADLQTTPFLATASLLGSFDLYGSVAPVPGPPAALVAYPDDDGPPTEHRFAGGQVAVELVDGTRDVPGDSSTRKVINHLVSSTVAGETYLIAMSYDSAYVMDAGGERIGWVLNTSVRPPSDTGTPPGDTDNLVDFDAVLMNTFVGAGAAPQLLLGTQASGGNTPLTTWEVDGSTPGIAAGSVPAVVFPAEGSGSFGNDRHSFAPRADGDLWVADDGDEYAPGDTQKAWLLSSAATPYVLFDDVPPLTIIDSGSQTTVSGPDPQIASVDLDGNGTEDVIVSFPALGEIWIDLDVGPQTAPLGRNDMEYVLLSTTRNLTGHFAVLGDEATPRGHALAVGYAGSTGDQMALLTSLPPLSAQPPNEIDITDGLTVGLSIGGLRRVPYDLVNGGDLDGDGCDDLAIHLVDEAYGYFPGRGQAFVLSGQ